MRKVFLTIVFFMVLSGVTWAATQDFKGTINGNTITAGTGTLTMSAGQTLTVSGSATISETPPLNANVIKGDGTAGRVLRITKILIEDGTDANTIKVTTSSEFNGDVNVLQDNIAKGATTGVYALNALGTTLTLLGTGITGDCVGVISGTWIYNDSDVQGFVTAYKNGTGIDIIIRNMATGAGQDFTTITAGMQFMISYITSQ